jgi:DNA gyrase inhibitor GyrI
MKIHVRVLPDLDVAYIRRVGSYFGPQEHWGKLMEWAAGNGLFPPKHEFIGISLDNPDLVGAGECRHDACVTIPKGFYKESHQEIHYKTLNGGLYALYSFYDSPEKLNEAYQFLYGTWLRNSEYEADFDRFNLEFSRNNPAEDPDGKCKVDLYVPINERR